MRDDPLAMPVAPQKRVRGIAVLTDSPKIYYNPLEFRKIFGNPKNDWFGVELLNDLDKGISKKDNYWSDY